MKSLGVFCLALCLALFTPAAMAQDVNGVAYSLHSENHTAVVCYPTANYPYTEPYKGSVHIPSTVYYDVDGDGNDEAFTVTTIQTHAFLRAELTSITLPNTLKTIEGAAFMHCSMPSIVVPNSVTEIGTYAFSFVEGLKSFGLSTQITRLSDDMFHGADFETFTIPGHVKTIGWQSFSYCEKMKSVVIPESVTKIEESAFTGCTSLEYVEIPNSVETIEGSVFMSTNSLKTAKLPDGLRAIPTNMFYYSGIEAIEIPENVEKIEDGAFAFCENLKRIVIPDKVESIGERAFRGCASLEFIRIPESVKEIKQWTFDETYNVTTAELGCPADITWCLPFTFKDLTFLENVTDYRDYQFQLLPLEKLTSRAIVPPLIDENKLTEEIFKNVPLFVPRESLEAYKTADVWKNFWNIRAIDDAAGIDGVTTQEKSSKTYNLLGVETNKAGNGIVIRDGKKFVVKNR